MVVQILVNAINKQHPDPIVNSRQTWKKGYPVIAKQQGWNWGLMQAPPIFSFVTITDATSVEQINEYVKPWIRKTAYQILAHDPSQDFFQVKIFSDPDVSGTAEAAQVLAKEMHDFLISWGASEIKDQNGVVFNITAMDAINGTGYINYGAEDSLVDFVQTSYDQAKGIHTIARDYSKTTTITPEAIEQSMKFSGCTLISHDIANKTYVFEANRTTMIQYLQQGVIQNFNIMIGRSQYCFPDSVVDKFYRSMTSQELKDLIIDIRNK